MAICEMTKFVLIASTMKRWRRHWRFAAIDALCKRFMSLLIITCCLFVSCEKDEMRLK
jgi:hypothetical protein